MEYNLITNHVDVVIPSLINLPNDVIKCIIHKLSNDIVTIHQFASSCKMIKTFVDDEMKEVIKNWFIMNLKDCFRYHHDHYDFDIQFLNQYGEIENIWVQLDEELNHDELKRNIIHKRNILNDTNIPSDDDFSIASSDYSFDTRHDSMETMITIKYKGESYYFAEFEDEGFDNAASYIYDIINRTFPIINILNHGGEINFENILFLTIIPPVKNPLHIKIYNRYKNNLIKMMQYDINSTEYFVLALQNSYVTYRIEKWLKYDDEKEDYFENYSDNKLYEDMIIPNLTYHMCNLFEIFIIKRELHYMFDKLLSAYTKNDELFKMQSYFDFIFVVNRHELLCLLKNYAEHGKLSPLLVKVLLPFPELYDCHQTEFLTEGQIKQLKHVVCLRRRIAFADTL